LLLSPSMLIPWRQELHLVQCWYPQYRVVPDIQQVFNKCLLTEWINKLE
jgi:hypothetical protein